MRKELVFKIKNKSYDVNKYLFQNDKYIININDVDTKKIVLSNKTIYVKHAANKYYIAYLNGSYKPLCIVIRNTKLHTNNMNVLANDNELLKYIEIWNKIEALFNEITLNKRGFHSALTHNNEYIRTRISSYNDFKKLTKDKYCGHSILFIIRLYL